MNKIFLFILFSSLLFGCKKQSYKIDKSKLEINDFVWKGLNSYYLWKPEISNLKDSKFTSQEELNNYLQNFNDPKDLFESLLYQRNVVDRWSWIVDDYVALERLFKGVRKSTGLRIGLVYEPGSSHDVFAFVKYVVPNSDAANKGLRRGYIFRKINGTRINDTNYSELLNNDILDIELAQWQGNNLVDTGNIIHLEKRELAENPIYNHQILQQNGKKIGYLMYNNFFSNYNNQLNSVFADFKNQNIDELILDLRYNSGGSVRTMEYLASMITGQFTGKELLQYQWYPQLQNWMKENYPASLKRYFTNNMGGIAINHLNLSRVYIIATQSSASASETLINCLEPYIDVIHIGTETHGKYTASITLYDSPDFQRYNANPDHKWALQPIVLKVANAQGTTDFINGLSPDIYLHEDYKNMGILGDVTEPLLNRALQTIQGITRPSKANHQFLDLKFKAYPLQNDMQADDVKLLKN